MKLKEDDGIVLLTLILDDKNNGVVQKLIDNQTNYGASDSSIVKQESLNISGNKAMYVRSRNTNQERMDIYLGNNATLSMARMYKDNWRRSFEGWAEKGWIFYSDLKKNVKKWNPSKAIPPKKASSYVSSPNSKKVEAKEIEKVEDDSIVSDSDVDSAVNLLKSFF